MSYLDHLNPSSGKYAGPESVANTAWQTIVSSAIATTATGTTPALSIPLGALVRSVGVLVTGALTGAGVDIDIGDGDDTDRYFDGLSDSATNVYLTSPYPKTVGATVPALTEISGRYYAAADTIDVLNNATATTGEIRVMAEYTLGDSLGT